MKISEIIINPIELFLYIKERQAYRNAIIRHRKNNNDFTRTHLERAMKYLKKSKRYQSASKAYRASLAKIFKDLRLLVPVIPVDYSKAKAEFIKFKAEGGVTSFEDVKIGDWVTCIRKGLNNLPVKGKTFVSYFLNGTDCGDIGFTMKVDKKYDGSNSVYSSEPEYHLYLGQFRFATPEEIEAAPHKFKILKKVKLQREIEGKERWIKDIEKEIASIKNEIQKCDE